MSLNPFFLINTNKKNKKNKTNKTNKKNKKNKTNKTKKQKTISKSFNQKGGIYNINREIDILFDKVYKCANDKCLNIKILNDKFNECDKLKNYKKVDECLDEENGFLSKQKTRDKCIKHKCKKEYNKLNKLRKLRTAKFLKLINKKS